MSVELGQKIRGRKEILKDSKAIEKVSGSIVQGLREGETFYAWSNTPWLV